MQKQYKEEMDQVHASEKLIQKTKRLIQDELDKESEHSQSKGKIVHFPYKQFTAAACMALIITVGGVGYYKANNQIQIDTTVLSGHTQIDTDPVLGQAGTVTDNLNTPNYVDGFSVEKSKEKSVIADILYNSVDKSKINGHTVYLCYDQSRNIYQAAYKKDEIHYLATGKNLSKREFLKELRQELN